MLAREDATEYRALLTALVKEHQSAAATEALLVKELVGIIWRKRRMLQAAGANINKGLKGAARDAEGVIPTAAPFELGLSGEGADLRDLMPLTLDEIAERQRDAQHDLAATEKAAAILQRGGAIAYD